MEELVAARRFGLRECAGLKFGFLVFLALN
jgi:hypothetical protein